MSTLGGYREYIEGCSVHQRDVMMHVGDIMSTSGDVQYIGGYHEYIWGCSVHRGDIMMHVGDQVRKNLSISIENPNVLNIPQFTHDIPRCTHDIPPMYSWYPPMY